MRLLGWLLVAVIFFHGFYSVSMAVSSYFTLSGIVDKAAEEHGKRGTVLVREAILRGAAESGVEVDDRNVVVSREDRQLEVRLKWSYPVLAIHGDPVLLIPMSIERTYRP